MAKRNVRPSGMCIRCSVRPTPGKGLGVFAEEAVTEGSTIWQHVAGQYEVLDEHALTKQLSEVSREEAADLLEHIISMEEFPGYMVRVFDEGALINHDERPNVTRIHNAGEDQRATGDSVTEITAALQHTRFDLVAACDIAVGDELLMDYNDEPDDPEYFEDACRRYGVTWDWL